MLDISSYDRFFFYANGVTPAMEEKMVGLRSQYAFATADADGNPFDGGRNYRLHVSAHPYYSLSSVNLQSDVT